jgi:hypothetical protein
VFTKPFSINKRKNELYWAVAQQFQEVIHVDTKNDETAEMGSGAMIKWYVMKKSKSYLCL